MDPSVWGPHAWFFLHTVTFTYPKNPTELDKRHMYDFFMKLQYILPCEMCKQHYQEHLYTMPLAPNLESRKTLILWLIRFHNKVNQSLGEPQKKAKDIILEYSQAYKNKKKKKKGVLIIRWIVILVILSVIGYYGYKYLKKHYSNKTPFLLASRGGRTKKAFRTVKTMNSSKKKFKLFSFKFPELNLPKLLK